MSKRCENCANYIYDGEAECYFCDAALDEDEMGRFLTEQSFNCPYFSLYDEYGLVRKQN